MPSPFPGMNPYLEHPELWPEVHHWMLTLVAESLVAKLRPKYRVAIEKRVYQMADEESLLVGIPDVSISASQPATDRDSSNVAVAAPPAKPLRVQIPMPEEVRESYLEVREVGTGEVVAVIELLSPKNKRSGEGRTAYESKRQKILGSFSHLVEIDLLRAGQPMPIVGQPIESLYRILVSRHNRRPSADLYIFGLQDPIPTFPLPLRSEDNEPLVDLQAILQAMYDRAGLDMAIDYRLEPVPSLTAEDTVWAKTVLPAPNSA